MRTGSGFRTILKLDPSTKFAVNRRDQDFSCEATWALRTLRTSLNPCSADSNQLKTSNNPLKAED